MDRFLYFVQLESLAALLTVLLGMHQQQELLKLKFGEQEEVLGVNVVVTIV
jgi:hypothetical protein